MNGNEVGVAPSLREMVRTVPANRRYAGPLKISGFGFIGVVAVSFLLAGLTAGQSRFALFGFLLAVVVVLGVADPLRNALPLFGSRWFGLRFLAWAALATAAALTVAF